MTLLTLKSALVVTGVTTGAVLFPGTGSGVLLVPAAVLVTLPVDAVTVALTTRVRVCPMAKLVVTAAALDPGAVTVVWLELALIKLKPALSTSVRVTFCAVLGPKLTNVTV